MKNSTVVKSLKVPEKCIFCPQTGVTKEHIWPEWMQKYIPLEFTHTSHEVFFERDIVHSELIAFSNGPMNNRTGDPISQGLKIVCADCNNRWMSRLQDCARPLIIPMLQGQPYSLDAAAQKTVAAWITMFTIVAECADPATIATSPEERTLFKNSQAPLNDWIISVGTCDPDLPRKSFHSGLASARRPVSLHANAMDMQITTAHLGHFLLHAISGLGRGLPDRNYCVDEAYHSSLGLVWIWPVMHERVEKSVRVLQADDVERIAYTLRDRLSPMNHLFPRLKPN